MVNAESVGGNLIIQHYRVVRAEKSFVEMYSAASRIFLFHLVPVTGAVRWTLTTGVGTITDGDHIVDGDDRSYPVTVRMSWRTCGCAERQRGAAFRHRGV
ncbi:hypothetical protein [Phytohabitans rumicis]|uniref:hypothetical protein n=1 Tax=Phytohabitans rumicis TaxID=1076125 RepID=UPI0031ECCA54